MPMLITCILLTPLLARVGAAMNSQSKVDSANCRLSTSPILPVRVAFAMTPSARTLICLSVLMLTGCLTVGVGLRDIKKYRRVRNELINIIRQ